MIHEILRVGLLECNCSILGDEASGEAIVVDPGEDIPRILRVLAKHNLRVKQIVVTHGHIDHIAGAVQLKRLTGAPVLYNERDLAQIQMMDAQAAWLGVPVPEVASPDDSLEDGRLVAVAGIAGAVLHTPGHTEGSVCLYVAGESLLLAGDTLFAGAVGRTDFPGGNERALMDSIHERLLVLPEDTVVVPGHGGMTTIGREAETNPFLGR